MAEVEQSPLTIVLDDAVIQANARVIGYELVNGFLGRFNVLNAALAMSPSKMLVFLTIATATVQRFMRQRAIPDTLHGKERLPKDVIGYISRRAIAQATGLPRETVRRIVIELMDEGLLITGPNGGVANKGGLLSRPEIADCIVELAHLLVPQIQILLKTGAIRMVRS